MRMYYINYIVFYGREIYKECKQIYIDGKLACTTKRKCKLYKTWSGVFNFLLNTTYEIRPAITRFKLVNDVWRQFSISVYFKPKIYMGFNDLVQIAGTADSVDGCNYK